MTSGNDTPDHEPFVSIGELLTRPRSDASAAVSPAVLATAIEQQGVYGWDSYGRFVHFKPDSKDDAAHHFREALRAIALEANHDWASWLDQFPEPSPANQGTGQGTVFDRYGWRAADVPDFHAIAASTPASPRRSPSDVRRDNADLTLIGVMQALMVDGAREGTLNIETGPPPYSTQADLIGAIVDVAQSNNLKGLGRTTLEGKFAQAKKIINGQLA
jgi:hypothetical protein